MKFWTMERWTESEKSYRKAVEFDPNYMLGKSLVGRITRKLEERETLLQELQKVKDKTNDNEKLLLDVIMAMNLITIEIKGLIHS